MEDKVSLGFTLDELQFLEWCMEFIAGGPFDSQTEEHRGVILHRVRIALSDYEEDIKRSPINVSSGERLVLGLTTDELQFLEWCMEFIVGGSFDAQIEEQRSYTSYRIRTALSDYREGIKRSPDGSSFSIECAFCEGTGAFPDIFPGDFDPEPCPVCDGRGLNMLRTTPDNVVKCRLCGSDGKARNSSGYYSGEVCPACQGKGIVSLVSTAESSDDAVIWDLIHPGIEKVSRSRYETNHYSDSVEAAFKEVNKVLKQIFRENTGEELDGAPLMYKAFSLKEPIVCLADLSTESGRNIQNGYMQIFAGAMTGIRNPKAHDNLEIDATRAVHLLMLASLLMFKLNDVQEID